MIKKYAAAALLLATVPAGAGAATTQQPAQPGGTTHTLHLRLHVTDARSMDKAHFVGTERVRSRDTHQLMGFDSFRGHIKAHTIVGDTAFAFRGGMLLMRTHTVGQAQTRYAGQVTGGTGAYAGATGSVTGRALGEDDTLFTIRYSR